MASKNRLTSVEALVSARPLAGPICQCLADFFREEFLKHHQCLEQQREYYSDMAIAEAESLGDRLVAAVVTAGSPSVEMEPWAFRPGAPFHFFPSSHPLPNDSSEAAGRAALALAGDVRGEDDLLLVCLSGGASA